MIFDELSNQVVVFLAFFNHHQSVADTKPVLEEE
jgi:hypothetical protein